MTTSRAGARAAVRAFVVAVMLGMARCQDVDFAREAVSGVTSHQPISIGPVPTDGRHASTALAPGPVYFAGKRADPGEVGGVVVYGLKDNDDPVSGWQVSTTLVPGDSVADTEFGMAGMAATSAMRDGTRHVALVVGAPKHTQGGANAGVAWVFHPAQRQFPFGPWNSAVKLAPAAPQANALCGYAVAANEITIAVGCPGINAVYVRRTAPGTSPI